MLGMLESISSSMWLSTTLTILNNLVLGVVGVGVAVVVEEVEVEVGEEAVILAVVVEELGVAVVVVEELESATAHHLRCPLLPPLTLLLLPTNIPTRVR